MKITEKIHGGSVEGHVGAIEENLRQRVRQKPMTRCVDP